MTGFPAATAPTTEAELDDLLSEPDPEVVADLSGVDGDLVVIGAGGKMGPTLCRMAQRAGVLAGSQRRVIAVSRFGGSAGALRGDLERSGVETMSVDLLDDDAVRQLPDAPNVVYMLGRKFGTTGSEALTWTVNSYLPGVVARRYAGSRILVFSTGNVYPFSSPSTGAPDESATVGPVGEYAQSCLGRERVFTDASERLGTRVLLYRLNYAVELRYGVLVEIASAVRDGRPVDLRMGTVNVIWQRDANAIALRALAHCTAPAEALNVSGPETVAVRWLAEQFGIRLGTRPTFAGEEGPHALLTNAARAYSRFGYPRMPLLRAVDWTAEWLRSGGGLLGKPSHFQESAGRF